MTHSVWRRGSFVTLLAAVVSPAAAQQQPVRLDDIVLGFFGFPRVVIDTPQAITVVDEEDIDRAVPTTAADLFDDVPGIQPIGSERPAGISFNIRGIGELVAADESRIIVSVDGVPKFYEQYRVGSFFSDPELFRRVEVLRGPASSTLYGAGALGGVVRFETRDASDFLEGGETGALRFRLGGQTNGEGGFGSVIYASRPSEDAEFLAALTYRLANNYKDGDGDEVSGSEFDSFSGLLKDTFSLGEGRTLSASVQAYDSDLDDTDYSQTGTLGFGTIDRSVRDTTVVLTFADEVIGDDLFDYELSAFYSDTRVEQDDASFGGFGSPLFADSEYGYRTAGVRAQNTARFDLGGAETFLTVGVEATQQERTASTELGPLGFHPEGTDTRFGAFAQAEIVISDLTLVPGIRVDRSELEPGPLVPGGANRSTTSVSPKLAMLYKIDEAWSVFGSISRTERAPTLDELFSTSADDPTSPEDESEGPSLALAPERSNAIEIGLAYSAALGSGEISAKATAFRYDIEDLIERRSIAERGGGLPQYRNIGEALIEGVEIEAGYEAERVFGRLAYTYVDGEDRATGERLGSIPAESLALTIGGRNPDLGLEYGWEGTFVDDISYGADEFSGYAVHDVFVGWTPRSSALEGFELRAAVDNVFDRDYRNSLAGDDGPGRNVRVSITRGIAW
ncbi:hemoglobin/transferrin/lactoferrin receptor protein [Hasllibacter halocynthiae]|uniref:Hemoglobin/transferrin/lactoferrin receptor protein n=1 Tax=Hasllibacter halocynthiae TaxID=595589 RepID=A0A2T0X9X2_9RHOB|nr:TonB-dependent receptor [Hasllibacter halocynthiae]PRY95727.1 hemoglobin/transferrin/lactoferrin receptor protein [Hasllibacter halocynthiae]